MAASLSRPDPASPASVAEAGFTTARRGYQQDEVRAFLVSVAAELGRLQERERQLEGELAELRNHTPETVELDDETVATMLGEETLRVLHTARESASEIKIRAEENAARIVREANEEANRLRQESEVEAARKRQDAASDAEAEVALAKQQGREMVNEARAYRERVLADLERRTTLARHQIEELIHGRDRLLQVFERARLVAVDVTSELSSLDGPDELVNLAPTTGPVPLMVPRDRPEPAARRPAPGGESAPDADGGDADRPDGADRDAGTDAGTAVAEADDGAGDDGAEAGDDEAEAGDGEADVGDDGAEAAGDTAEVAPAAAAAPKPADANVVSLFRGRAPAPAPETDDATDTATGDETDDSTDTATDDATSTETDADTDAAPAGAADVDGLFARLRSEVPQSAEEPTAEIPATDAAEDAPAPATAFTRRDEAIVPLIVAGARKVKRVLADEQNGVLDTLRRNEPVTALDQLLPAVDEHVARYVDALGDELVGAAAAGAAETGVNDTKTLRRKLPRTGALESAHHLLGTHLVGPLRERLERSIADGSGDNEDITKRVRAVYREWKTQHIDDQLDDVFRFAHGGGLATSVDPGVAMVWSIDPAEPACADCEDNSLAGPVAAGDAYPTGHTSAPAHPGCRCLTLPVGQ